MLIHHNPSIGGIDKPEKCHYQRSFARPRAANNANALTGLYVRIDVLQHQLQARPIAD